MKVNYTLHFLERSKERNIPSDLDKIRLRETSKKRRSFIRKQCPLNGISHQHVYFTALLNQKEICYVLKQLDINHYLAITCFEIDDNYINYEHIKKLKT